LFNHSNANNYSAFSHSSSSPSVTSNKVYIFLFRNHEETLEQAQLPQ
jgi:hypothetical protein